MVSIGSAILIPVTTKGRKRFPAILILATESTEDTEIKKKNNVFREKSDKIARNGEAY
jgi:hypothetical protein